MPAKIPSTLIREQGAVLRRITLEDRRAEEIAEEVAGLNGAVLDAADRLLDFNDDPGRFAAFLASGAHPAKAKRGGRK